MKKFFYLSTCDTCKKIMKTLPLEGVDLVDIKTNNMSAADLDKCKDLQGSYEDLFSKRARKYKELGLKDKNLSEQEIRQYILEEYTFLKRPVLLLDGVCVAGNSKKSIEAMHDALL